MEQILLAYGLLKETVTVIMMLNKNMKEMVCSADRNTDFFDIVSGILLRDTLAPYLLIICQDNVLQTLVDLIKENAFIHTKSKKQADDI